MLLPRFSIRTLMMMITIGAFACLIIGMAFRGKAWALAASIGIGSLAVVALVHASVFGVIWLLASLPSSKANKQP